MPAIKDHQRTKITPPALARKWGVSEEKIYAFIRAGSLRAVNLATQLGGKPRWMIDLADVLAFEQARSNAPAMKPQRRRRQNAPAAQAIEFV
jgi:hypothetical protein